MKSKTQDCRNCDVHDSCSSHQPQLKNMKKITVTKYKEATDVGHENPQFSTMELEGPEDMVASDGYHTFDELYDHRITLYIALGKKMNDADEQEKALKSFKEGFAFDRNGWIRKVWRSKLHSDGTLFDGWYILGIGKEKGTQITYHIPIERWEESDFAETLDKAPEWDGHSSSDVIKRIMKI